jgi:hypothetical protein
LLTLRSPWRQEAMTIAPGNPNEEMRQAILGSSFVFD